ncbi:MAG: YceI family protein [Thermonemataceae bacterium]
MTTQTATQWNIDPTHSEILFRVRHMMVSNVTGAFNTFEGSLESETEDFTEARIQFTAQVDSISTNNTQRDEHLRSKDFFDASRFPQLTFVSSTFTKQSEENYQLTGNLTIRDKTKPVTLTVVYNGTAVDPYGQTKAGFEISGKINRKDFGLTWSAVTEAGNVVVSEEVKLVMNIQLIKQ